MHALSLLALLLALPASARRNKAVVVPPVPSIEAVVQAEGFTPTPSQSDIYRPGTVLVDNGRGGHDVVVEDCVASEPTVAIMSQSSIATTLAGGVSARLGAARGSATVGVEKRLSFVDPEQRTIPLARLRPTAECVQGVETAGAFRDLSDAILVHDVLVAVIQNTVCTRADADGAAVALGSAEASAFAECVQESDAQVPLGFKAVPLSKALALVGGSLSPTTAAAPQATPPPAPVVASPSAVAPAPKPAPDPAPTNAVAAAIPAKDSPVGGRGAVRIVVHPYTSSIRVPKSVDKTLATGGMDWSLTDDALTFTQVARNLIAGDFRMTRYGAETTVEVPAGRYAISCIGLDVKLGLSTSKIVDKGAWMNTGASHVDVKAGETTTLEIHPEVRREMMGYVPLFMVAPRVRQGSDGSLADICAQTGSSIDWPDYTGPFKP